MVGYICLLVSILELVVRIELIVLNLGAVQVGWVSGYPVVL